MKKLALAISVVALVVSAASCSKKGPESVVKKYYTHFYKGEYDKIQDVVLEEHRSWYGLLTQFMNEEAKEKASKTSVSVTNVKCKITDGTEAICSCKVTVDGEEEDHTVRLEKLKKVEMSAKDDEEVVFNGNVVFTKEDIKNCLRCQSLLNSKRCKECGTRYKVSEVWLVDQGKEEPVRMENLENEDDGDEYDDEEEITL